MVAKDHIAAVAPIYQSFVMGVCASLAACLCFLVCLCLLCFEANKYDDDDDDVSGGANT